MPDHPLHEPVLDWFNRTARPLPWRSADCSPWGVLVSEVMLQQTPVARVEPVWHAWLSRWPKPADLAVEPAGEAIRLWGRLGYPRRALRLHACAFALVELHGGEVPDDYAALIALPGIGEYTAAAVASFAFGRRHPVLDTNVRRVLARTVSGKAVADPATSASERALAGSLLPDDASRAARWAAASMELGALICTARAPRCDDCPVRTLCRWRLGGAPAATGPARPAQRWHGTDRQVRGKIMAALRAAPDGIHTADLAAAAPDPQLQDPGQRDRCLASLVADGLVQQAPDGYLRLP